MGQIKYLVFDVDNTLLDFDLSLMTTQKAVADRIGYAFTEEYYLTDRELMYEAWNDYQMTQTHDLEIQEHWHRHYRMQIVRHYELLMERIGMNVDPYELLKLNFDTISGMHHMMEAVTLDVFRDLSRTYKNVIATNCVTEIKGRLSIFEPYCYRIFLSDEIHAIKPTATFFNVMLNSLGCRPEECMMIGDSAADDMAGGKRAGLHTCWYRPGNDQKTCPDADYRIQSIAELPPLLESIQGRVAVLTPGFHPARLANVLLHHLATVRPNCQDLRLFSDHRVSKTRRTRKGENENDRGQERNTMEKKTVCYSSTSSFAYHQLFGIFLVLLSRG